MFAYVFVLLSLLLCMRVCVLLSLSDLLEPVSDDGMRGWMGLVGANNHQCCLHLHIMIYYGSIS